MNTQPARPYRPNSHPHAGHWLTQEASDASDLLAVLLPAQGRAPIAIETIASGARPTVAALRFGLEARRPRAVEAPRKGSRGCAAGAS
jgi:hypothetical protein